MQGTGGGAHPAGRTEGGAMPLATLHAESGPLAGRVFSITDSPFTIGRGADNSLVVMDSPVSRRHAQLELRENRWFVHDLDSSNGTFLNRQPLKGAQPLTSGDLISLGDTVLAFSVQGAPGRPIARPLQPMAGAAAHAARPAAKRRTGGWLVAAIVAVVLILLVLAAVLLAGGLKGKTTETEPGGPGISLPGLPSGLPELPTGLPELPTGLPELPTGLPGLPTGLPGLPSGLPGLPSGLPKLP